MSSWFAVIGGRNCTVRLFPMVEIRASLDILKALVRVCCPANTDLEVKLPTSFPFAKLQEQGADSLVERKVCKPANCCAVNGKPDVFDKMPSLFGHATEVAQSFQGNCQSGESFLLDDLLPAPTNSGTMSDGAVSVPGNLVEDHVLNFLGAGPPASPFCLHAVAEVFS